MKPILQTLITSYFKELLINSGPLDVFFLSYLLPSLGCIIVICFMLYFSVLFYETNMIYIFHIFMLFLMFIYFIAENVHPWPFSTNSPSPWPTPLVTTSLITLSKSLFVCLWSIDDYNTISIPGTQYTGISAAAAAAKSLQSCPTLCDPIDGSLPGSPVPRILQARTLEWVAISFSNAGKWRGKVKSLSRARLFATPWTWEFAFPASSLVVLLLLVQT